MGQNIIAQLGQAITQLLSSHSNMLQSTGIDIFRGLATILIVWFGIKAALSAVQGHGGFNFAKFADLLLMISLGLGMLTYYSTPIPGTSYSFSDLITKEGLNLSTEIESDQTQQIATTINNAEQQLGAPPGSFNILEDLTYLLIAVILAAMEAAAFSVIAYGYVAAAVCVLIGPIFIPWFIVPKMDWLFWGWLNPNQFKVISQSVKKTDKNDAEMLALYLEKGLLPEVRMKERNQRNMAHLAQTRDLLVKQRSALKAKINNLLSAEGINLKREALSSNKALERVLAMSLPPILAVEARVLVAQVRSLTGSIADLERLIEAEGPKLAGHENLTSIKGIGTVSATVLLSAIGRIEDFADPGKLAAYLGIVPRVQNSNETERSGHITKQGNKLARTALVQCALIAKRFSPYLQNFYQRIQRRRGGGKANIALARKFLGVIFYTLKNKWVFEDFPNFVLAS